MKERPWWTLTDSETCAQLKTDPEKGLSEEEAVRRLEKFGKNLLPTKKRISAIKIFLRQFSTIIVWILIGALIISGILQEWVDALAIGIIVLLNAIIGFIQEYSAERSIESLKKLVHPISKVVRDGILKNIASSELVPGDLVILEAGDNVPADGRITSWAFLGTQEASLTGESVTTFKNSEKIELEKLPIGDRKNMLFAGTIVVSGKGSMITTETGIKTELGKIAEFLKEDQVEKTPLQMNVEALGKKLLLICLFIIIIIAILGYIRNYSFMNIVLIALSLAVAAIPEGLPATITIALASGVMKMVKRNALVRRLSSVETLGSTSVICTDKTGTLTQSKMVVQSIWLNNSFITVEGIGYEPRGTFAINGKPVNPLEVDELMVALKIGALCNNAKLDDIDNKWQIIGDPTDGAILTVAGKAQINKDDLKNEFSLVGEIPFDSQRKMMSVVLEHKGKKLIYCKGAPDTILSKSKNILINGKTIPIDETLQKKIISANSFMANRELRVLAVAYRKIQDEPIDKSLEEKLTFVALLGMIDPPRPEAKEAVRICKDAGINVVMVTGDFKDTGVAIAKEIGLFEEDSRALSAQELDKMHDDQLKKIIDKVHVFARASAEQKMRIIKIWKSLGKIIAMTGDGVNDAPAIKAADIGIAMGITGSEITKETADMIILDDNFATIVNAVEEGRAIYDNIIKFIHYIISTNFAELLVIFLALIIGFKDIHGNLFIPLLPIQILWINLVTDGLPAVALAFDPASPGIMKKKPRSPKTQLLPLNITLYLFIMGIIMAVGTIITCHYGITKSQQVGHTMAFTTMVILEFVRIQTIRSQYHLSFWSNKLLIVALLTSLLLQFGIIYIHPLQKIFKTTSLGYMEWAVILIVSFIMWLTINLTIFIKNTSSIKQVKMAKEN